MTHPQDQGMFSKVTQQPYDIQMATHGPCRMYKLSILREQRMLKQHKPYQMHKESSVGDILQYLICCLIQRMWILP